MEPIESLDDKIAAWEARMAQRRAAPPVPAAPAVPVPAPAAPTVPVAPSGADIRVLAAAARMMEG